MIQNNSYDADTLHEECGVFGMYDFDGADVASTIYYGLFALQHRGQESCGIAVSDTSGPKGKVLSYKGMGLVNEVFAPENLEQMKGDIGVGHVRYSTAGSSTRENAQPLVLNYVKGTLALAHNGNLINAPQLRKELEYTGAIFQTTIDSEVIAYYIARERLNSQSAEEAVRRACQRLKGAYALVVASPRKLIGARDPYGFKPLCIGKRDNSYIITSETCALDTIGATFVRDVLPGEVVTISPEKGIESDMTMALPKEKEARCIFEYIYFARPDSHIDGVSVYASRIKAGKFLAQDSPVEADLVTGVPESGNAAALGYSLASGIPYGTAFVKNGYVGRTFIKPKQSSRESSVQVKLYSGDTLLTTATLQGVTPGSYDFLTCCIATETADEYWSLTPWTPKDNIVPNKAVLFVDGHEQDTKTFTLDTDEWANLPGTAFPSSGSTTGGESHWHPPVTPAPVPVVVIPPKTGDMTIWQSILHFLGIR